MTHVVDTWVRHFRVRRGSVRFADRAWAEVRLSRGWTEHWEAGPYHPQAGTPIGTRDVDLADLVARYPAQADQLIQAHEDMLHAAGLAVEAARARIHKRERELSNAKAST